MSKKIGKAACTPHGRHLFPVFVSYAGVNEKVGGNAGSGEKNSFPFSLPVYSCYVGKFLYHETNGSITTPQRLLVA